MSASRRILWLVWAAFVAAVALELAIPGLLPPRPQPWDAAQTAVAEFILAIFSLVAGVGTFALRETFALRRIRVGTLDPLTPEGFRRVRVVLVALWSLCLLIALFGGVLAYAAANPRDAWPYVGGAAFLLVVHAPRGWIFTRPEAASA